jgi:hypothetical protein
MRNPASRKIDRELNAEKPLAVGAKRPEPNYGLTPALTWATARTMDFRAESCVKCIEGSEAGQIYGCVQWGYYYDALASIFPANRVKGGVTQIWMK